MAAARFLELAFRSQGLAQAGPRLGLLRIEIDRSAKCGERLVVVAKVDEGITEIEGNISRHRIESGGPAQGGNRIVRTSEGPQRHTQVALVDRRIGVERDRLPEPVDGPLMIATLVSDQPQEVVRIGMGRIDLQGQFVEAGRLVQPARLVMRESVGDTMSAVPIVASIGAPISRGVVPLYKSTVRVKEHQFDRTVTKRKPCADSHVS